MNCVATVRHIARESVETTPRTCCARIRRVIPFVYQPETTAYLETVGIVNDGTIYFSSTIYEITGSAIWTAVDNCVIAIKTALGLTLGAVTLPNRMKFWYPRIGGTATRHKYNAVDPTTFVGTYNGGFTHDGSGDTPNGTNAYFDTGCNYMSNNFASVSTQAFGVIIKDNVNALESDLTSFPPSNAQMGIYPRVGGNYITRLGGNGVNDSDAVADSLGSFIISREISTEYKKYKNGSLEKTVTENTNTMVAVGGFNIVEYAAQANNTILQYSTKKHTQSFGMHTGLSPTEVLDIHNALINLDTALNRN